MSFLKWKVIVIKSWLRVIYWKPVLKFKSHSFLILSQVSKRTHAKRKLYFFYKWACATDVKSLKIHCGIPTFYYFHVLFPPSCFLKLCPFPPPNRSDSKWKTLLTRISKSWGVIWTLQSPGRWVPPLTDCPLPWLVCSTALAFPSPRTLPLWSRSSLQLRKYFKTSSVGRLGTGYQLFNM